MASNAKKVIPLGQKIPESKMRAALAGKYGSAARKEAQAAHNINE